MKKATSKPTSYRQQLGESIERCSSCIEAHKLAASDAAMKTLESKPYDQAFQQEVNNNVQRFGKQFANNSEALAAGLVSSYLNSSSNSDIERLGTALQQAGIIDSSYPHGNPQANSHLKSESTSRISDNQSNNVETHLKLPESPRSG